MGEAKRRTRVLTEEQAENQQAELEAGVQEGLPPAGHERRELERKSQDQLQAEAERVAQQMMRGTLDASKLDIVNDIANKTHFLTVSNAQPGWVYAWVSKNRFSQHIQMAKSLGWVTVQADDPEALELRGGAGTGTPDTTRQLGDVILMKIPEERYIVLKAMEVKRQRDRQKAAVAGLRELGEQNRGKGFIVRPFGMEDPDGDLSGPAVEPRSFTSKRGAMRMIDRHLRDGSVPGMEVSRA